VRLKPHLPLAPPSRGRRKGKGHFHINSTNAEPGMLNETLTNSRLIARNAAINLLGYGAPLAAAFFSIPLLMDALGTALFGILSLVWVLFGYLGLFDLGLGRALTQMVAQELGRGARENIPNIVWTGSAILAGVGAVLAALCWFFIPFLVISVLRLSPELIDETLWSFRILTASLPFLLLSLGLRGVLEAYQKFSATNAVRIPMGVFTFIGPVLVLPFSSTLTAISVVLASGRVVSCIAYLIICPVLIPDLRNKASIRPALTISLLRFGGWVTITNIINPLLFYIERFFIAATLSATAVAYYATPSEIITKLLLVSSAFMGVLYPAFAASFASDRKRTEALFMGGIKYIGISLFPIAMLVVLYAEEGLALWMGSEFASQSAPVLKWLSPGVLILSLGHIPYALIQGAGRPDIAAKLHLVELPIYLALLYWWTVSYGIVGAAKAWTLRGVFETSIMYIIALAILKSKGFDIPNLMKILLSGSFILCLFAILEGKYLKAAATVTFIPAYFAVVWYKWLSPNERSFIGSLFHRLSRSGGKR